MLTQEGRRKDKQEEIVNCESAKRYASSYPVQLHSIRCSVKQSKI